MTATPQRDEVLLAMTRERDILASDLAAARLQLAGFHERVDSLETAAALAAGECARLEALINTPRTDDFFEAVKLEAAHQVDRWGAAHDDGKADPDWFWLLGYLAGKVLRGDEKRLHHIITTAAACLNWWRHAIGTSSAMRPGIAPDEIAIPDAPPQPSNIELVDQLLEARGLNR